MTCSDFLTRYSGFRDGKLSGSEREAFESHLDECRSCARYHRVVTRGVRLLQTLPRQRLHDDFRDRLRHSLYTLDEERRLRRHRPHGATGAGAMFVVAAAVLLVTAVLTPSLWDTAPTVELPPIAAQSPPAAASASSFEPAFDPRPRQRTSAVYERDLWSGSNALLFEHSSLYERHRTPSLVRAGTQ